MNKIFTVKFGDRNVKLCFNMIFGEQLGKLLKCEPTPASLMTALLELNEKSSFLMSKAIVYCGIIGHDYMVGFEESITQEEVGVLLANADEAQLTDLFNKMSEELGFKLNAEAVDEDVDDKKKETKTEKS